MQTQTIRRQFLQYFKDQKHSIISSSPVCPHDDPTLLFTNAGMNQFKDVFLGNSERDYKRAATSQKCIRAGGKHNDLENVGHTRRHLTFFEMLGNFSFGDYFKKEAIQFAWDLSTKVWGFDPQRIWPTVFKDDDEAFELWLQHVPAERITRFGEKDNFWAMGETGPCGPCSELLFDRGATYGEAIKPIEDTSGERFLEYWNLVFMQYNKRPDGILEPLPKPSIDTGAGLERVVALKMNVDNLFETDILRNLIAQVENVTGKPYHLTGDQSAPFRVIADHLRCLSFAIADGAQPSNIDRGYVLRKILRRAVRYGRMLGQENPFLAKVLPRLVSEMGSDYSELIQSQNRIAEILTLEEEAFFRTLKRGGNILNHIIENSQKKQERQITGDDAFKLKDTYGLPLEEVALIAKDANLSVDYERYHLLEKEAKDRSRSVHKTVQQTAGENIFATALQEQGPTQFLGYSQHQEVAKVIGLLKENQFVSELEEGAEGIVLLDRTPFYAEMGGQVGDTGLIQESEHHRHSNPPKFHVTNTLSPYKGIIAHYGTLLEGKLTLGDTIIATIDDARRQKIANNHTATHLLHWALHKVLGEHVKQGGSVVDSHRLRFDFSHHKALTQEEIRKIEDLVNEKIRENLNVSWYELPYEEAQQRQDIKQFFGEKYGSTVRVIDIDYSKELCGGTHTSALGNIGLFRIAKESSIAAGMRRIEAVTGAEAEALSRETDDALNEMADLLKIPVAKLKDRIEKLVEENKELIAGAKAIRKEQLNGILSALSSKIEKLGNYSILISELNVTADELKTCVDDALNKWHLEALVLATKIDEKCSVIVRINQELINKGIKANEIVQLIAPIIEGSGGGKPGSAQAGGKAVNKLSEALDKAKAYIAERA